MVSCQKGPTRHAYAWQIGPFWQDTLELFDVLRIQHMGISGLTNMWLLAVDVRVRNDYNPTAWLSGSMNVDF